MTFTYPAVYRYEDDGPGKFKGYYVFFPDLPYATQGNDLGDADIMALDILNGTLQDCIEGGEPLPPPSAVDDIETEDGDIIKLVTGDPYRYFFEEIIALNPKIYGDKKRLEKSSAMFEEFKRNWEAENGDRREEPKEGAVFVKRHEEPAKATA